MRALFEQWVSACIESEEGLKQALHYDKVEERYTTEWVQQRWVGWRACAEEIYIKLDEVLK